MDGVTLSEAMHNRGINIRYLGKVTYLLSKVKQLEYLHSIAVGELVLRSAKHIFTAYLQSCEMMNLSVAVAHFLNCFFYSGVVAANQLQNDEVSHVTLQQAPNLEISSRVRTTRNETKEEDEPIR